MACRLKAFATKEDVDGRKATSHVTFYGGVEPGLDSKATTGVTMDIVGAGF